MGNRRPKYRIWDKKNICWYKPTYRAYEGNMEDLKLSPHGELIMAKLVNGQIELIHESLFRDRFEVVECTGLKDENGIEIYDGDNLFAPGNLDDELQYVGTVEWDENDARWEVVNFHGRFEYIPNGCIVQGNKYEPKEANNHVQTPETLTD